MNGQTKPALALGVIAFVLRQFQNHSECQTERQFRELSRELNLQSELLHDLLVIASVRLDVGIYGWPLNGRDGKEVYPGANMELRNWMIHGTHRVWYDCAPLYTEYIVPAIDGPKQTIALARQCRSLNDPGLQWELDAFIMASSDERRKIYDFIVSPRGQMT